MGKKLLLFLLFYWASYGHAQNADRTGWTFLPASTVAEDDVKYFVDEIRSSLPEGSVCSYSAKSGELNIIVSSNADPIDFIAKLNKQEIFLVPVGRTLLSHQKQIASAQKQLAEENKLKKGTTPPVITQEEFDAASPEEQQRLRSLNVIIK